jgi:uncharacterized membrane protein YqjE
MPTSAPGAPFRSAPSLFQSAREYLATWVEVLKTRVELFSTEWQEECQRLEQIFILAAATVLCLALGVLLVTLFVVVAFWDTNYRLAVLGAFGLFYLATGLLVGFLMRRKARSKPKIFANTLDELAKDYQELSS